MDEESFHLLSLLLGRVWNVRPVFLIGSGPSFMESTIRVSPVSDKMDPQIIVGCEGAGRNAVASPADCEHLFTESVKQHKAKF